MAAKRSPTLPPPPTDGASPPVRRRGIEIRLSIPHELVERLDQLALQDNRDRRRQAEWLLWDAIRVALLDEEERPVPYTIVPAEKEDETP